MMPLVLLAGALASCQSPDALDTNQQLFVAVDMPPLTSDRASTGGISFTDYDGDGDPDIYVTNGYDVSSPDPRPQANRFYENVQGHFEARSIEGLDDVEGFSSGSAWGDVDNDGDQDPYAGNLYGMANNLYENLGDGTFRVMDGGRATTDAGPSYAVTFGDLDNDADLDLVVANWGGASEIYLNDGAGHFEQTLSGAFRRSIHYASSLALGDYDGDGDLDILIGNWPNHPGEGFEENVLIENRFADGNWIRVALEGDTSNRSAIGALIVVETTTDGKIRQQIREVSTQSGWRSQGELTQHFGLGLVTCSNRQQRNSRSQLCSLR